MRLMRISILTLVLGLWLGNGFAADAKVKVIALFTDKAMLQVGDKKKIVKKGETFEGVLLKSASGRGAVVVVDGKQRKLGLNQSSIVGNYKKTDLGSLKIYPDSQGMYYVQGRINGEATRFLVDTGATFVTLSGRKARSLKIDYLRGERGTAQTAASVVPVWQIKLNSVKVGGITMNNVDATVIKGDQPFEVLLGNSFLRRTVMQKAGAVLEIKKRY